MSTQNEAIARARKTALHSLKLRPRSIGEIHQKLKTKKFSEDIIKETINFLTDYGFLDDAEFARAWIQDRLMRPFGVYRIKKELREKQVSKDVVEAQVELATQDYNEQEIVHDLVQRRLIRLEGLEPEKKRKRLFDFLTRRGFSSSSIIGAIKKI